MNFFFERFMNTEMALEPSVAGWQNEFPGKQYICDISTVNGRGLSTSV